MTIDFTRIVISLVYKNFYGYAESSSSSLITTKRTKDTKGE